MKILFVLPRMVSGGVERVTLSLIRGFQHEGHHCALALRRAHGEFLDEARSLCVVHEIAAGGLHQFVPRLARLIRTWQPTHVVTAFADIGVLTWLAMRIARRRPRWVHGVHNTHAPITARKGAWGRARYRLDNRVASFVYHHADAVVAVSEGVRNEILARFHLTSNRVTTIYNPVVSEGQLRGVPEPRHDPAQPFTIVAIGRLTRQKGFDVLIEAMRDVPQPWKLDIWGEGEERSSLEQLTARYGLESTIRLRGYTNDPYVVLRSADLLVLPSRWEGLANVLIEALTCQCQIVATDCPHGPREILQDGKLGRLVRVGDASSLADAIDAAKSGRGLIRPQLLLARAREFSVTAAYARWKTLLRTIARD